MPRPIRDTVLDAAFTDLDRDDQGVATVVLRDPATGRGVALWVDERHRWLQVYSADDAPARARVLAVEPMTAPADAFRSATTWSPWPRPVSPVTSCPASWGIRALV